MEIIYSLDELVVAAGKFTSVAKDHKVFAFYGNLGAGKTTFIRAVCKNLGVEQNVSSPTFSIINEYKTIRGETIYHIDLYRIKDEEEAIRAGVEECMYSNNLCFVEWPERALGLFPPGTTSVHFEVLSEDKRKIIIKDSVS
jgi:tRNA threonylcarbamoyladenosine biosynthesis protein TsaE